MADTGKITATTIIAPMKPAIQSTVPVLASLDLDQTLDFYTRVLGFARLGRWNDYAIVARDGAEIHFWLCAERHIAENTSCYVRATDLQALYEEFHARGARIDPPVSRPWGMRELYVSDPHGNLLKFGHPEVV